MKAWKLVDEEHADAVSSGSVRIGTLAGYAALEDSRADDLDGAVRLKADRLFSEVPHHRDALRGTLFEGAAFVVDSTIDMTLPPTYAFCMTKVGCTYQPSPPKPRVMFEIADVERLALLIVQKNTDRLGGRWHGSNVRYARRRFNLEEMVRPPPAPFIKDTSFAHEQELRLIFEPRVGVPAGPFNTSPDGEIGALIKRIVA